MVDHACYRSEQIGDAGIQVFSSVLVAVQAEIVSGLGEDQEALFFVLDALALLLCLGIGSEEVSGMVVVVVVVGDVVVVVVVGNDDDQLSQSSIYRDNNHSDTPQTL